MTSSTSLSATSSTYSNSPAIQFITNELAPSDVPSLKQTVNDWQQLSIQRYNQANATFHSKDSSPKPNAALVETLKKSATIITQMGNFLNERAYIDAPHSYTRIYVCHDTLKVHAIAIVELIGFELKFIATHPDNINGISRVAGAATHIINHLKQIATDTSRSITIHSDPAATQFFTKMGFQPFLSNKEYTKLLKSCRDALPRDCYLNFTPIQAETTQAPSTFEASSDNNQSPKKKRNITQ